LPAGDWSLIRVNPADFETATALFPLARIESDPEIPGGLIATSGDGRVTIDNTWSTRLRRIWSRLAPKLLREVAQDAGAG
jgi:vacuolar-type H+-ATPase subunit E/Vma4